MKLPHCPVVAVVLCCKLHNVCSWENHCCPGSRKIAPSRGSTAKVVGVQGLAQLQTALRTAANCQVFHWQRRVCTLTPRHRQHSVTRSRWKKRASDAAGEKVITRSPSQMILPPDTPGQATHRQPGRADTV